MKRIKILIVAFTDSIHTARWVAQLDRNRYEIHLFPSVPFRPIHPELRNLTVWQWNREKDDEEKGLRFRNPSFTYRILEKGAGQAWMRSMTARIRQWQQISLSRTIRLLGPRVLHSMESQKAGYLVSKIIQNNKRFRWAHSTWGIDLAYFQSFPDHRKKLEQMMLQINTLVVEGDRDEDFARQLGYRGECIIIPSVGGSMDFNLFDSLDDGSAPSRRKTIIMKGYEGHERLASNSLKALRLIKQRLAGYEVIVHSCSRELQPLVAEIQAGGEFMLNIMNHMEYRELLRLTAGSRLSITNNLSDGVPNTMLEAMALGSFPIQSNTAITAGWIEHGKNGWLTNPLDVEQIAAAIQSALEDDALVDNAAIRNRQLVRRRLNSDTIQPEVEKIYH